jgi:hypothetical protein
MTTSDPHVNPDPDPASTPGLDAGGSVQPGDTPPGEASTSGVSFRQPDLPSQRTNKLVYGVVIGLSVLVALMLVGYVVGLLG